MEKLRQGQYLYGILVGNSIKEKIVASNVESAYRQHNYIRDEVEVVVRRTYDHCVGGKDYKTYYAFKEGSYTNSVINIILM
jgi:hypothetical protein